MSVARHHAEWLSLVEVSGPFLSMPVLMRVFPQGLDQIDRERTAQLRESYAEWAEEGQKVLPRHRSWVQYVLTTLLEYPRDLILEGQNIPAGLEASMPQFGERIQPDMVLKRDTDALPSLLISIYPPGQSLDGPIAGKVWKACPGTRMMELLHATDIPTGLVTNGEEWMLVYAPRGETTGFASWYADLWMQEPITLRAFQSLLCLRRFYGVAADDTLSAMLNASSKDQQEVTNQLGYQVRQAVEVLVEALDQVDAESGRALLAKVNEQAIYDAALTVMMRLVFLFAAEERELLLLGDPLYDQYYAVSTLRDDLREKADQYGEEVLERRQDAWCRLLSTFRALYGGVQHDAMRLPAYGGTLFDPDRYPFLEGRPVNTSWKVCPAHPLPINNRVVLHLLEALQILQIKVPGGGPAEARRLSFRMLDIEQIGHVYEGLLDHTAKKADEVILGLSGTRDREPEVPLAELESLRVKGVDALVDFLKDETGRSKNALQRALESQDMINLDKLVTACGQDRELLERARPFASLIREDSFGRLVVIRPGSVYVTSGTARRSTGTHYTPRSLTEPVVQYTLEPLVYLGPAEGQPKAEWKLKSPKEILDLKVCDMAMGSGAFLVQACRYLSERLVEAWEQTEKANPGMMVATPEGEFSVGDPRERLIPADPAERIAIAKRFIADRCLYGVDINPMAVEMAKLSIWLVTLQKDRPFNFLDHAFKCGDSLLGISSIKQLEKFSLRPDQAEPVFGALNLFRYIEDAAAKRRKLEALSSNQYSDIQAKSELYAEAETAVSRLRYAADLLISIELQGLSAGEYNGVRQEVSEQVTYFWSKKSIDEFRQLAIDQLSGRRTFHWPLEFPEVFERGGFTAIVGNPPYLGGRKIRGTLGGTYLNFLTSCLYPGSSANTDLCAFFIRRANALVEQGGITGFIATSSMSEGDTRVVGLQALLDSGSSIIRASTKSIWPGTAGVTYSPVWIYRGDWKGVFCLDGNAVLKINSFLTESGSLDLAPKKLKRNYELSFQGSIPLGEGFVLTQEEANHLIDKDETNKKAILPYLVGKELNIHPKHETSQWIINFHDWPLDRESAPNGYDGPVAADYPDCLEIIRQRVYPERKKKKRDKTWWQYWRLRPELYSVLRQLEWSLAIATQATKYVAFGKVTGQVVYSNAIAIIASDDFALAAVLSSSIHEVWARRYGGYNLLLLRYSPSDLFDTFALPSLNSDLRELGQQYYELRSNAMVDRDEGLTKIYNRFHDADEQSHDIQRLRGLQVEMDQAVAAAYGWDNFDLGHGFHETKQGIRFTISEEARKEVLQRLLRLNHERYAEEVAAGLHDKGSKAKKTKKGTKKGKAEEPRLF